MSCSAWSGIAKLDIQKSRIKFRSIMALNIHPSLFLVVLSSPDVWKWFFPLILVIFVLFPSFSPSQIQDLIINEITSTPSHRFYELHSVPLKSLTGESADYAALIYLSKLGIFAEENHISKSNNSFLSLHIHVASATSRIWICEDIMWALDKTGNFS